MSTKSSSQQEKVILKDKLTTWFFVPVILWSVPLSVVAHIIGVIAENSDDPEVTSLLSKLILLIFVPWFIVFGIKVVEWFKTSLSVSNTTFTYHHKSKKSSGRTVVSSGLMERKYLYRDTNIPISSIRSVVIENEWYSFFSRSQTLEIFSRGSSSPLKIKNVGYANNIKSLLDALAEHPDLVVPTPGNKPRKAHSLPAATVTHAPPHPHLPPPPLLPPPPPASTASEGINTWDQNPPPPLPSPPGNFDGTSREQ